jgi:hypothetical protein
MYNVFLLGHFALRFNIDATILLLKNKISRIPDTGWPVLRA